MNVTVRRQGRWLLVASDRSQNCYPKDTTAADLDAWADAQDERVRYFTDLRDTLRAAAKAKRAQES